MSKTKKRSSRSKSKRIIKRLPFSTSALLGVMAVLALAGLILIFRSKAITVYTIPSTIVSRAGSCDPSQPDVTQQFREWVMSLPDNSIAKLGSNRCYRIEGYFQISSGRDPKVNFTVDGNGSKLQAFTDGCLDQSNDGIEYNHCKYGPGGIVNGGEVPGGWPRNRFRLNIEKGKNITVRNLKLDGGHPNAGPDGIYDPDLEAQHAVNFEDTDGALIENSRADRVWGDYVYINQGSRNITIRQNVFGEDNGAKSGNGRQGMAITGSNVHIENNRIVNVRRTSIDIEPGGSGTISGIYIDNNYFGQGHLNFFSNLNYGNANPRIENIYFRNNVLQGKAFGADSRPWIMPDPDDPSTYRRRNYQFIGNTTDVAGGNPKGMLLSLVGIDGVVVQNNSARVQIRAQNQPKMVLVQTRFSRNVKVTGNRTENAEMTGRYLNDPDGNALQNRNVCEQGNYGYDPLRLIPNSPGAANCTTAPPPANLPSATITAPKHNAYIKGVVGLSASGNSATSKVEYFVFEPNSYVPKYKIGTATSKTQLGWFILWDTNFASGNRLPNGPTLIQPLAYGRKGQTQWGPRITVNLKNTKTYYPSDDSYVRNDLRDTNLSGYKFLRSSNQLTTCSAEPCSSYTRKIYLKFYPDDVCGCPIASVKLRLSTADGSGSAGSVYPVHDFWVEKGITWNNAPAIDITKRLATLGGIAAGKVAEFTLPTSAINQGSETYSFAIQNSDRNFVEYHSRETFIGSPTLTIEYK